MFLTSWEHLRPVPHKRDPLRQISASHNKSPPRTTSWSFARAVSVSDQGANQTTWHDPRARTPPLRRVGDRFPVPCKCTSWRPARATGPDRSHNVALLGCGAVKFPSSPTLQHASSARGTQAPPTMSSGLRLGLNVATRPVFGRTKSPPNYSEGVPSVPG
jgi:hypothetical protein